MSNSMTSSNSDFSQQHDSTSRNRSHTRPRRVLCSAISFAVSQDVKKRKARIRQKRFRDRRRSLANADQSSIVPENEDAVMYDAECPPPPYIATHQRIAIADFFERLRTINTCLPICITCKESFLNMRMSGMRCERCSKEVRSLNYIIFSSLMFVLHVMMAA